MKNLLFKDRTNTRLIIIILGSIALMPGSLTYKSFVELFPYMVMAVIATVLGWKLFDVLWQKHKEQSFTQDDIQKIQHFQQWVDEQMRSHDLNEANRTFLAASRKASEINRRDHLIVALEIILFENRDSARDRGIESAFDEVASFFRGVKSGAFYPQKSGGL